MRELVYELGIDMANLGIGIFGTDDSADRNIFVGTMPVDVTEGIMLTMVNSPPPERYIDTEYQIIDIWVKSPKTDRAFDIMRSIYNAYNRRYHWNTDNWHVYFSDVLGSTYDASRNGEGSKLLRLSIQFMCRNLNNVS